MVFRRPPRKNRGVDRAYRDTGKIVGDILAPATEESLWEVLANEIAADTHILLWGCSNRSV